MAGYSQYEADRLDGVNGDGASEKQSSIEAQLRATVNVIPAHVWYANPSGALVFVNSRSADYLGLPKDHLFVWESTLVERGILTFLCCTQMITKRRAESGLPVFAPAVRARWPFEFVTRRGNIDGS